MQRCIYCLDPLEPSGDQNHPKLPSLEHIVPYSLGGSSGCATTEVCKQCNSRFGETVDADLVGQTIVGMLRQEHRTAGYSGSIPDVVLKGRALGIDEPATLIIPVDEPATARLRPRVSRRPVPSGEEVQLAGTREEVRRILEGIVGKARARGHRFMGFPDDATVDDMLKIASLQESSDFKVSVPVDFIAVHRALIKIAFGFAHLALGWSWTSSKNAASLRHAMAPGSDPDAVAARVEGMKIDMRAVLPPPVPANPTHHVLALLPGENSRILVSLFGQELLTVAVRIDCDEDQLVDGLMNSPGMMACIDHSVRKTEWVGIQAFTRHMAGRLL